MEEPTTRSGDDLPAEGQSDSSNEPAPQGLKKKVRRAAGGMKEQIRSRGTELKRSARRAAENQAAQRKDRAAAKISRVAGALRRTGDSLREGEVEKLASYPDSLAEQLESWADHLRGSDFSELVHEVEDFARRRPEVFFGGALLAGILTGRFLRASSPTAGGRRERPGDFGSLGHVRDDSGTESYGYRGYSTGSDDAGRSNLMNHDAGKESPDPDAPNYSGSRDYDEAGSGSGTSGGDQSGTADPGAGANYAERRDYDEAAPSPQNVPEDSDPMPGGGRTGRENE